MSRLHHDLTVNPEARLARRLQDLDDGATARLQPPGARIVSGFVPTSGSPPIGGGFGYEKLEAGQRTRVLFNNAFQGQPVVTFSPISGGGIGGNIIFLSSAEFQIDIYGIALTRINAAFTFFAREAV